jgi:hypothetical protein
MTTRDSDVLASVYCHRFLSAEHVHQLHFQTSSRRVAQVRLQRMWAARLLDRLYLPPEIPDRRDRRVGPPLYSLAGRGAAVVAERLNLDIAAIPHTSAQNRQGYAHLRHNLVFTDLAVALKAFAAVNQPWMATVAREDQLQKQLSRTRGGLLPDGAVTMKHPGLQVPQTYLIEVVRATAKGGNQTIVRRLYRYRAALRAEFFRKTFGFMWVTHIVLLTPTLRRAHILATLARDIPGAERLFRFGAYETRIGVETPTSAFSPATIATPWLLTPAQLQVPLLPVISNPSPPLHV